jgi:hypothetical protein
VEVILTRKVRRSCLLHMKYEAAALHSFTNYSLSNPSNFSTFYQSHSPSNHSSSSRLLIPLHSPFPRHSYPPFLPRLTCRFAIIKYVSIRSPYPVREKCIVSRSSGLSCFAEMTSIISIAAAREEETSSGGADISPIVFGMKV